MLFRSKLLYQSSDDLKNLQSQGTSTSENSEVGTLQMCLEILGFSLPKWGVDGKFGEETEEAIKNFQKNNGLVDDGVISKDLVKKIILNTTDEISKNPSILDKIQIKRIEPSNDIETKSDIKKDKVEKAKDVTSTSDSEYLILKPNGYTGNKVHVLFGGAHTSGYSKGSYKPQAIKNYANAMSQYATNIIILVTHHMNTLENVRKYAKEKFDGEVTSLAGFSQGGREAWRHADDKIGRAHV